MNTKIEKPAPVVNNWKGTLGFYLKNHRDELNACKTKEALIEFLKSIPVEDLNTDAQAYREKLILDFSGRSTFDRCIYQVWQVLLAGEGLKTLK